MDIPDFDLKFPHTPLWKDPASGKYRTQSLFLEHNYPEADSVVVFTMKEHDHTYSNGKVYPSFKKLYMLIGDPTEYLQSQLMAANWKHWKAMCRNKVIAPLIEECREELAAKIRSEGIRSMREIAKTEKGQQAAKWLAEKGWAESAGKGRPSKEAIEAKVREEAAIERALQEDVDLLKQYAGKH